ncbi:glycosyltransferase family 39 protein [Punctularia strigosozonata HHB-11173 SS5]|uniref:Dolichyl-phosphate-mannose--protein mannosyltransferase n=1 Tax=Punctularia strigosozonata (strain HHB-11173) TaxID=741275 RepID=R7S2B9_PUNST|nr:glycosyltransferase family 39 protein [Punctularia strigosozonata HHB-11173 SS5]EIN04348.1 glycosyltransferase family 39 protein [Punctularia strigosozonata HHB-11173 SS5]
MSMRARRPASPPLGHTSQRFPHRKQDHLDADERRAAASLGLGPGQKKAFPAGGIRMTSGEWKLLVFITLVAAAVRLFRLSRPNSVVFDEVHFGKFASKYIKTQYFVDVHPPLAKLLITLAAFVFGYDGNFDFKDIAKVYDHVPYVAMRMVPAVLGVATVPIAYITLRALDCRATTALMAALFVTFENALATQSRFILLDSPLVFFTALTVLLWTGFCNEDKHKAFTTGWWTWLALSGLSLGAVSSCKWVGLFTVATVGLSTIKQLWLLLGDLRVSPRLLMRHFMARALCLIVVPILFYMAMFEIHFLILENSGDGDGFMSSEFQHTLGGKGMADTYADVALGSVVSIRHVNTQGGYLHSHPHTYPGGSKQQQVTLYPHRDDNNNWRVENATVLDDHFFNWETDPIRPVTDGMRIKLQHVNTEKRLHSHEIRPPISDVDFQNEVSAYGMKGFPGDMNDDWILEIDHGSGGDRESWKRLRTLRTQFKLKHALSGCYLFSHKVKLPEWGFEQQEVTCNKNAVRENSLWYVETNTHQMLPQNAPKVNYKLPGFFGKFIELQQVMWRTNAGLTDRHAYDSRPDAWPRLLRGINFWVKDHRQIYLIGNPIIWWMSTLAVLIYASARGLLILREKRGFRDFDNTKVVKYDHLCGFLFMGWCLHYLPFYLMNRQLFLHHYLPALYFAILLCCSVFDLATSTLKARVRFGIAAILIAIAIATFSHFSPLTYGSAWTKKECQDAKWLKTWDFSCNDFLDDYSGYANLATPARSAVPVRPQGGRGAAVVNNKPVQDAEHTSSVIMQAPEPGRDAFAQEPVRDIKSAPPPPGQQVPPPPQSDEISSDPPAPAEPAAKADDEPEEKKAVPEAEAETAPPKAAEPETQPSPVVDQPAPPVVKAEAEAPEVPAQGKPAGPLGEDDAEAARIAQELYPDEGGQ